VSPLKLSIEWLKDYIEIPDGIQKLSDDFTMSGSEVEAIEKPFENLKNLVTAKIVEIDRHPNADNLNVCKIEDGKRVFTIVTSDKTLKVNDCVIFGQAGKASDINGKVVQSVEMRGIGTDGMLFSLQEIGLEAHSSHVFKFDKYVEL
jgi:phenylalanyl-tRNA synthetase beta chain